VTRAWYENGTGNLNDHVKSCVGKLAPAKQQIVKFATGGHIDAGQFRYNQLMWTATNFRPYKIVEDKYLRETYRTLNPNVDSVLVSADTVSRDVKEAMDMTVPQVKEFLRQLPGCVHLSFDGWTSHTVHSFLGVVVHYALKGKMHNFILDFISCVYSFRHIIAVNSTLD
jgi:hypothetical protein